MIRFNDRDAFLQPPHAVLLDTDNTLYAYDPSHKLAHEAVRAKVVKTFSISAAKFEDAYAEARRETKSRLHGSAASHSRLLYFQRMLELIGLGSQVLLALDLEQTYWRTFLSSAELFEDMKEFLDDLRLAGIPVAIVTDLTAQIQFRKIVYFGLDSYVDHIVTSEEAGHDKPHRAPFDLALGKLQPRGGRIWMIGDNPDADIAGAKAAIGAITLQKIHAGVHEGEGDQQPHCTFEEFGELRSLLKRQLSAELTASDRKESA